MGDLSNKLREASAPSTSDQLAQLAAALAPKSAPPAPSRLQAAPEDTRLGKQGLGGMGGMLKKIAGGQQSLPFGSNVGDSALLDMFGSAGI